MKANAIDYERMIIPTDYCDCRFFCFRILLSCYDLYPSEEEMLGLGEGLSVSLMNTSPLLTKVYCPVGRTMHLETTFGERLGIGITSHCFKADSITETIDQVKQRIDVGDPIVANADRYYLEYLPVQRAHIGNHTVFVFGYDDDDQVLFLFDALMGSKVIALPYRMFYKAVFSDCLITTNNMWYSVEGRNNMPNEEDRRRIATVAICNTSQRIITEAELTRSVVKELLNSNRDAAVINPQLGRFLIIQSKVFFQSFIEQDGHARIMV